MFFKIFLFMLCINIGAGVLNGISFLNQSVPITVEAQPSIFNSTFGNDFTPASQAYLVANITNPRNYTSTTDPLFNWFNDSTERIFFVPEAVIKVFTGTFAVNVVNNAATSAGFTWPDYFVYGLHAQFGVFLAVWLLYLYTGRSTSGAT